MTPLNQNQPVPDFSAPKWEPANPDFKAFIEQKLERQHFMRHIGFELTTIEAGLMEGEAPFEQFLAQQDGYVHGGVTATLADLVCGFAAFSLVKKQERVVSADLKISYFRPGSGNVVKARGYVIKPGSRFHFCEGHIWTEGAKGATIIAKASAVMAVFTPGDAHPPSSG